MVTFAKFIENAASKREFVNLLFEQRVFELMGTLQKLSLPLEEAAVPHELVGGLAVFLHVENADSTHSSLTRDIDVMIRRDDLPRVVTSELPRLGNTACGAHSVAPSGVHTDTAPGSTSTRMRFVFPRSPPSSS